MVSSSIGRRAAMRECPSGSVGTVTYLLGDQLGSTSLALSDAGAIVGEQKYYAYGRPRGTTTVPTDKLFTGHQKEGDLYFMQARFYDPTIGRFLSPDTIVPSASEPGALNRYAYVYNNPLAYTDPTGHITTCGACDEWGAALCAIDSNLPGCPAPDSSDGGGGGGDDGGSGDPSQHTLDVVGEPDPSTVYPFGDHDEIAAMQAGWKYLTVFAADQFLALGLDLDDLPWSWDQRFYLESLKYRITSERGKLERMMHTLDDPTVRAAGLVGLGVARVSFTRMGAQAMAKVGFKPGMSVMQLVANAEGAGWTRVPSRGPTQGMIFTDPKTGVTVRIVAPGGVATIMLGGKTHLETT